MKITQTKNTPIRKVLLMGALAAILLVIGVGLYVYAFNGSILGWPKGKSNSDSTINYEPPTQAQKDEGLSAKGAFVDKHYPNTDEKDVSERDNTAREEVSIIISSISQTSDIVQIRTTIQTVNSGTCTFVMSAPGLNAITREVETQNLGSYSTCKGFDVPLSELQAGTWDVVISYENNTGAGSTSQKMEIKK